MRQKKPIHKLHKYVSFLCCEQNTWINSLFCPWSKSDLVRISLMLEVLVQYNRFSNTKITELLLMKLAEGLTMILVVHYSIKKLYNLNFQFWMVFNVHRSSRFVLVLWARFRTRCKIPVGKSPKSPKLLESSFNTRRG